MNMTVGHIMLEVVAGFVFALGLAGFIPLLFTGILILFEVFIVVLQAYIFTILTCIYLSEAFEEEWKEIEMEDSMQYVAQAAKYLSIGICSLVMISVAKWVAQIWITIISSRAFRVKSQLEGTIH